MNLVPLESISSSEAKCYAILTSLHMFESSEIGKALLYDPKISSKAAIRQKHRSSSPCGSCSPTSKSFVHKQRQKSVRDTLYKKKRGLVDDKGVLDGIANGGSHINLGEDDLDILVDLDDHAFSQMVDLLATGGIEAVIGAFPVNLSWNRSRIPRTKSRLRVYPRDSSQTKLDKPNGAAENDVSEDAKKELRSRPEMIKSKETAPIEKNYHIEDGRECMTSGPGYTLPASTCRVSPYLF
ncbi:hypothetical protein SELMODRAFT_418985 [Selaginella moellendorffii]|uniref:Uncharacterized protein n=1 Tax=Selaginella moellendorffii TaxID=88036 RepID=D8S7F9_SELML|nr:hypothetical protein SELMODRAFT_418985 [Selaginella moellendorffii]